jgi:lipid-A-disaccharide synthase
MNKAKTRIMIIAGEPSGDLHAAKLVEALLARVPPDSTEIFGSAGSAMRKAGVEAVVRADELSIVGVIEIGRALPMFLRAWRCLKSALKQRKPDVVILVDFPEFNLKFARAARRAGTKVVYYISPQLWAWRQYRLRSIQKDVDLLLSIMPFEKDWYSSRGVEHVQYVGNPTGNHVRPRISSEHFRELHNLEDEPVVALLPGSRSKEIERVLPVMLNAFMLIRQEHARTQAFIAAAGSKQQSQIQQILQRQCPRLTGPETGVTVLVDQTYDLLNAADVAAVTSGTATLETGIIGTPLVVVYRSSGLNYSLLRPLISVEHFGLVNLIAGERIATELIQHDLTAESLATELERLLEPSVNSEMRSKLNGLKEKLGSTDAADSAAEAVIELMRS